MPQGKLIAQQYIIDTAPEPNQHMYQRQLVQVLPLRPISLQGLYLPLLKPKGKLPPQLILSEIVNQRNLTKVTDTVNTSDTYNYLSIHMVLTKIMPLHSDKFYDENFVTFCHKV